MFQRPLATEVLVLNLYYFYSHCVLPLSRLNFRGLSVVWQAHLPYQGSLNAEKLGRTYFKPTPFPLFLFPLHLRGRLSHPFSSLRPQFHAWASTVSSRLDPFSCLPTGLSVLGFLLFNSFSIRVTSLPKNRY